MPTSSRPDFPSLSVLFPIRPVWLNILTVAITLLQELPMSYDA